MLQQISTNVPHRMEDVKTFVSIMLEVSPATVRRNLEKRVQVIELFIVGLLFYGNDIYAFSHKIA